MTLMELVDQFVDACDVKEKLADHLSDANKHCAECEEELMGRMVEEGTQSVKRVTGETVYLKRKTFPIFPAGKEAAVTVLAAHPEFADLFRTDIHSATLAKLVREREGDFPASWEGIIDTGVMYRVSVLRS